MGQLQLLQKSQEHTRELKILEKVKERTTDYKQMYFDSLDEINCLKQENLSMRQQLQTAYAQFEKDSGIEKNACDDSLKNEIVMLKEKLEVITREFDQSKKLLRSINNLNEQVRQLLNNGIAFLIVPYCFINIHLKLTF